MNTDLANALADAIIEYGEEASVRHDYSGRGMYGEATSAVVVDNDRVVLPAVMFSVHLFTDFEPDHFLFSQDSMGQGIVLY